MSGINGRAAKLLGQSTEVVIKELTVAPQLFVTLEHGIPQAGLSGPCMRVLDVLAGRATYCQVNPPFCRSLAEQLLQFADTLDPQGGQHGSATVHE